MTLEEFLDCSIVVELAIYPMIRKDSSSTISPLEKGMAPAASCPAAMQVETATAP